MPSGMRSADTNGSATDGIPPAEVYVRRLEARRAVVAQWARMDAAIAWSRLAAAISAIVVGAVAFKVERISGLWTVVPVAAFLTLVVVHDSVIRKGVRALRGVRLYEDGLARVEDRAPPGDGRSRRFDDERHPYAADLDLFGTDSLYERLSTARTTMGEETLAAWLKAPAATEEVRARQLAIAELAPRLDLKEDMAVMGTDLRADVNPTTLAAWAAGPPLPLAWPGGLAGARITSALLGASVTGALVAGLAGRIGAIAFVCSAVVAGAWVGKLRALTRAILTDADRRAGELKLVTGLLARLERESFQAPLLDRLRRELDAAPGQSGRPLSPSLRVKRLSFLVDLLDARRNQISAILTAPLLWTTQAALAIEAWRRNDGPAIARWLAAVGEIEALASLSTFAFEHPEYPFPEVLADGAPPCLESLGLAHPLLPARVRVANDVAMGGPNPRLVIVSGSNMSGKSTLLRTVGVNVVLALAGAPVCARRMVVSRVAIGGTLRIHDSLHEGRSRFYAEITRLRQIVDLAEGPLPALFLLDELLSGTNSHDRRVGAQGILRGLLERGAIGLATTHDLALTEMAAPLGAANVHFDDDVRDGQMSFDYRMHPGVVQKSNALALMRAVGLDVGDQVAEGAFAPRPRQ